MRSCRSRWAARIATGTRPAANLKTALREQLADLTGRSGETLVAERYEKFRKLGAFEEASVPTR